MTVVLAPCPGRLLAVSEVPDPVFSSEMVGPGVAIDPGGEPLTAVSPIAGRIVKLHPHAYVVLGGDGVGVLVHLGIDTVRLDGKGFELLAEEGAEVEAGQPVVRWDPQPALDAGMSTVVPVVVMDRPKGSVPDPGRRTVAAAEPLFDITL